MQKAAADHPRGVGESQLRCGKAQTRKDDRRRRVRCCTTHGPLSTDRSYYLHAAFQRQAGARTTRAEPLYCSQRGTIVPIFLHLLPEGRTCRCWQSSRFFSLSAAARSRRRSTRSHRPGSSRPRPGLFSSTGHREIRTIFCRLHRRHPVLRRRPRPVLRRRPRPVPRPARCRNTVRRSGTTVRPEIRITPKTVTEECRDFARKRERTAEGEGCYGRRPCGRLFLVVPGGRFDSISS